MSASSVRPTSGAQTPSTEKTRRLTSGDKKKAASRLDAINERKWKLRVISSGTSSVLLAKDTEREERLKALKEGWEIANPGRLVRAKELRDNYNRGEGIGASTIGVCIKVRETVTSVGGMTTSLSNVYGVGKTMPSRGGSRNALVTSGSSSIIGNQPRVLNETDLAAREESRNQRAQQYQTLIAAVRRDRLRDKETRAQLKSQQFQPLEQLAQEAERYNREDDTRRLAYRKYMRELEEEARARKLAELAAESAAAEAALPTVVEEDKSKKKGKK